MAYLKEQFDDKSLHLNGLCDLLTKEITELATEEYKLKLMFVLVHIIEESQKALGEIDINNCLKELRELVNKACEQTEKQKEVLNVRYDQDKQVRNIIDGTNADLQALDKVIEPLLARYEDLLNTLITIREKLPIEKQIELEKK